MQKQVAASRGGLLASIEGTGLNLVSQGVKKLIEIDKKKYNAQYKAGLHELFFYNNVSPKSALDPLGIQFNGIDITRTFDNTENSNDTAMYVSLKVDVEDPYELINNSIFRLKLDDFRLNYAKCKVPARVIYLPWTWFYKKVTTINLDFELSLNANWMTREGVFYNKIEIGKFYYSFRGLPLERKAQHEYVQNILKDPKKEKKSKLEGYSMLVPRSFGYYLDSEGNPQECWGQGLYSVTIDIKESAKEKFITRVVQDNSNMLVDQIKGQIKFK